MTNEIKAIQTEYRGITYRSRTEARWAAFFDEIRLPFAYEPEGIDLDGDWYLPDFWLPVPGLWFEVKGTAPTPREMRVVRKLADASRSLVVIAVGTPPTDERYTLLAIQTGREVEEAAFTGWGESIFISNESQQFNHLIRGSFDTGGMPRVLTEPARAVAGLRFGVHERQPTRHEVLRGLLWRRP